MLRRPIFPGHLILADSRRGRKNPGEKIRITYAANTLSFLVMFIAKDRGFYSKYGLDADLVQVRPNVAIIALLSGDANYTEVLGSAIRSAAKGAPVRAISTTIRRLFLALRQTRNSSPSRI